MDPNPQPILLTSESQENVRKWIETLWKIVSAVAMAVGTACIIWIRLTFATREEVQIDRDATRKELQIERESRMQQINDANRQIEHLTEQRDINVRVDAKLADHETRIRSMEHGTAWGGKMLDRHFLRGCSEWPERYSVNRFTFTGSTRRSRLDFK